MESEPAATASGWRDALLGCAVFLVGLFLQITGSFSAEDEAWFVQVVRRVLDGDVLYRDVAFGINPLSVYVITPLAWLFGPELLVVKFVQSLVFTAAALVVLRIVRKLGARGVVADVAVLAGLLACAPPGATISLYTPLSMLFVVCALDETIDWLDGRECGRVHRAMRGGLWIGAAFAAKQNVGILAFIALAVVLVTVRPSSEGGSSNDRWRDLGRMTMGAAIVVAVVLAPVLLTGGFAAFLDFGYFGKTTYLRVAGIDPFTTLSDWTRALVGCQSVEGLRQFLVIQAAILPVLVFGGLAGLAPVWWAADRRRTLAILVFALVGYAASFPRADLAHIAGAVPVLLVAFVHVVVLARARVPRRVGLAACTALFVMGTAGAASRVASGAIRCASPNHQISRLPGLQGILAPKSYLDDIRRRADDLDVLLERKDAVFLLSARSGMFSLVGNRTNPTPFDYPFVTTLGSEGEDGLIAMLESGRIQRVCIDTLGVKAGPLWPAKFEAEVQRRFRVVGWAGNWVLYGRADEPSQ